MTNIIFSIIVIFIFSGCSSKEEPKPKENTVTITDKVQAGVKTYCKRYPDYKPIEFKDYEDVKGGFEVYHSYETTEGGKTIQKNAWFELNGIYEVTHVTNHNPPE